MPLLWLRVATAFYGLGLLHAFIALTRRNESLSRIIMPVMGLGFVFQFVSLAEGYLQAGRLFPASIHNSESLLAFLLMAFVFGAFLRSRNNAFGIFIFPVVFLLTFSAAVGQQPPQFSSPLLRSGWIFIHVALIFTGYAALFFSFAASVLYLVQERGLKAKSIGVLTRLPALEIIDDIGYKSLLLGFPFMTFGLLLGAAIAASTFGPTFFQDPKVFLSVIMWLVYMVLLYTRWNAGWRGRRAAFLSMAVFLAALGAFAANYFSGVHRFIAS
jgi:ABC-type transport system involved in cytochrome c biogenesis permease subunit